MSEISNECVCGHEFEEHGRMIEVDHFVYEQPCLAANCKCRRFQRKYSRSGHRRIPQADPDIPPENLQ